VDNAPVFWLGRQPILDRSGSTVAYELLFRSGDINRATIPDSRTATARVISHAFSELGLAQVLGEHRGFINFDSELLLSDVLEALPPDQTVIEILETVRITPRIIERCRELRGRGFSFAMDDVVQLESAYALLLPIIDVVKIDVSDLAADALATLVRRVRAAWGAKLLAEKIDTKEQAERCRELGFDLFQGFFFARPTIIRGRRADPSKHQLMRLLEQSLDESNDNSAIEATFKEAPELSYKLMRLVNSVGVAARSPIQSLAHALAILGRRQLQRWSQVLLFAHHSTGEFPSPLLQLAASRGKLMELLAERGARERALHDRAFMTGILSLLDVLLELPMGEVVEHLRLPDDVRTALLERSGRLGHLLKIVEALERTDDEALSSLLAQHDPCTPAELAAIQIAALNWSNALGKPQEG
jgi:EAL and modified HD-GYP domain-containing signal transduction protein